MPVSEGTRVGEGTCRHSWQRPGAVQRPRGRKTKRLRHCRGSAFNVVCGEMNGVWVLPKRNEGADESPRMVGGSCCQLGSLLWPRQEEAQQRGGDPTRLHEEEVPYLLLPPPAVCVHVCSSSETSDWGRDAESGPLPRAGTPPQCSRRNFKGPGRWPKAEEGPELQKQLEGNLFVLCYS